MLVSEDWRTKSRKTVASVIDQDWRRNNTGKVGIQ